MSGRFITLEGGEGVGKSTQAGLLADALRAHGLDVVQTREPGGTPGAEAIRALLMTGVEERWTPRTEALLFAAARADHVARLIRPALARGQWVICDRYVDSTRAYQGGTDGLEDRDILDLHRAGTGGLMPDRTLLLALAGSAGSARARARDNGAADRMGARDPAYYARVDGRFRDIAAAEPQRVRMIDAEGPVEAVTARLIAALADLLP